MNKLKKLHKFITDKNIRTVALGNRGFCKFMSDDEYLKRKYRVIMGKELNLDNPQTFNEKLQWLKLYDRKHIYTTMVDKYEAKKYVGDIIGEEYIIPTLGVWNKFDDINFDELPNQFVLKSTHDSGGLIICKDKLKLDKKQARMIINKSLKRKYFYFHREWPYKNVKPRIIAEAFMEQDSNIKLFNLPRGLMDYKFYCFNGIPKFLYISKGLENHKTANMNFLDLEWNKTEFQRNDYKEFSVLPKKPSKFEDMIKISMKLSQGIPFVRIDLYEINFKVYFSEITFSPCAGMTCFTPEKWDYKLGEMIQLPNIEK